MSTLTSQMEKYKDGASICGMDAIGFILVGCFLFDFLAGRKEKKRNVLRS